MTTGKDVERQLDQARRRAFRHWYEDGISEMVIGGYFLVLSLLSFAADRAGSNSWLARTEDMLLVLYVLAGAFLVRWLVQRGKEQVTYVRSGYVRFPGPTQKRWIRFAAIALLAAALAAVIVFAQVSWSSVFYVALQSLIFFSVFLYLGVQARLVRFYVVAVAGGLLPWIGQFLGLESPLRNTFVYGGVGALLLISGLWAFLHFVRRPPLDVEGGSHA